MKQNTRISRWIVGLTFLFLIGFILWQSAANSSGKLALGQEKPQLILEVAEKRGNTLEVLIRNQQGEVIAKVRVENISPQATSKDLLDIIKSDAAVRELTGNGSLQLSDPKGFLPEVKKQEKLSLEEQLNEALNASVRIKVVGAGGDLANGSGFSIGEAISKDKRAELELIITNYHVVSAVQGGKVFVEIFDNQGKVIKEIKAEVIAADKNRDLALLSIPAQAVPSVKITDERPKIGQKLYQIGCPGGESPQFFDETTRIKHNKKGDCYLKGVTSQSRESSGMSKIGPSGNVETYMFVFITETGEEFPTRAREGRSGGLLGMTNQERNFRVVGVTNIADPKGGGGAISNTEIINFLKENLGEDMTNHLVERKPSPKTQPASSGRSRQQSDQFESPRTSGSQLPAKPASTSPVYSEP